MIAEPETTPTRGDVSHAAVLSLLRILVAFAAVYVGGYVVNRVPLPWP